MNGLTSKRSEHQSSSLSSHNIKLVIKCDLLFCIMYMVTYTILISIILMRQSSYKVVEASWNCVNGIYDIFLIHFCLCSRYFSPEKNLLYCNRDENKEQWWGNVSFCKKDGLIVEHFKISFSEYRNFSVSLKWNHIWMYIA